MFTGRHRGALFRVNGEEGAVRRMGGEEDGRGGECLIEFVLNTFRNIVLGNSPKFTKKWVAITHHTPSSAALL